MTAGHSSDARAVRLRRAMAAAAFAASTALCASFASAQTATFNASSLALRSGGTTAGSDVTLDANGYAGTYITLANPGAVTLSVNASGVTDGGAAPHLNLVVGDVRRTFDVAAGANAYTGTVSLPAGTYFVRLDYDNDAPNAAARALTLKALTVSGATVVNTAMNANALAAADSYIANFRKGQAHVALTGPGGVPLLQGTAVRAQMLRNAFNFGGTVSGATLNDSKDMLGVANPAAGTEQQKFQDFVKANFNTIVPSNAGKWAYDEATQNSVNMSLPDRDLRWAAANNKRARMHTLIWATGTNGGNQEPAWVRTLISQAAAGDQTAKANLRTAISNRIKYYAGTTGNRSAKYIEVDGLNESLHQPAYLNIFGVDGVAGIYNELNSAIAAAGGKSRTYLNEWNVLQYAPASVDTTGAGTGSDPYANYYRRHIDDVRNAGGNVGGIGIQYYANYNQTGTNAHSANTIQKALQNLSIENLPISMDEFGGATSMTKADSAAGATVLDETLQMFYGNPNATTFMVWGWWDLSTAGTTYPPAALLDNSQGNTVLTPMGQAWVNAMKAWSTDTTATVAADGSIAFDGFYGDYNIGGQSGFSNLTFAKGTNAYTLQLAAPPGWSLFKPTAATGDWNTAANWTSGIPSGAGMTAHFLPDTAARAITLDTAVTLGQINFDGAAGYTVGGAGAIRLETTIGPAALNVVGGSHAIDVPVTLANDTRIVVRDAASTLTLNALADAPTVALTKLGDGVLRVNHLHVATLDIAGGTVAATSIDGPGSTNFLNDLSIADGASLDLNGSACSISNAGDSQTSAAAIRAWIASGRAGGSWTGDGITSTRARTDSRLAVGYAEAASLSANTRAALGVDVSSIVLRVTLAGDANLDGVVGFDDLLAVARHYGTVGNAAWVDGDTNYDGAVDFSDLLQLARNYGSAAGLSTEQSASFANPLGEDWALAQAMLPEPSAAAIVVASCGFALRRW